jgi:hypothetical protein
VYDTENISAKNAAFWGRWLCARCGEFPHDLVGDSGEEMACAKRQGMTRADDTVVEPVNLLVYQLKTLRGTAITGNGDFAGFFCATSG